MTALSTPSTRFRSWKALPDELAALTLRQVDPPHRGTATLNLEQRLARTAVHVVGRSSGLVLCPLPQCLGWPIALLSSWGHLPLSAVSVAVEKHSVAVCIPLEFRAKDGTVQCVCGVGVACALVFSLLTLCAAVLQVTAPTVRHG